ncbi:MAG: hypothetical protein AAF731_03635 [Bacteroidota bacterium]
MPKSWTEKYNNGKEAVVKTLEKKFSDMITSDQMLIATPKMIDHYIRQIPKGKKVNLKTMRKDAALDFNADNMCPLTTGFFLHIVIEKGHEENEAGTSIDKITPFWRVIDEKSPILKKLSFDARSYLNLL